MIDKIERKKATSGKVSYCDPKVIDQNSKTRTKALAYFISRSSGQDELHLKIIKEEKAERLPFYQEGRSINLSHTATLNLYHFLVSHLETAKQGADGEYLLIKISDGENNIKYFERDTVVNTLLKVLNEKDIVEYLSSKEISSEVRNSLRLAMRTNEMKEAIQELKYYLDDGEVKEQVYQKWCEKYSWVFGSCYLTSDQVRRISAKDNIDLLLPTVFSRFRDIIELKRPDMEVLNHDNNHQNFYFSSEVSKAIGQCKRYIRVFREQAKYGLEDNKEIIACEPKAIIVIGRSIGWEGDKVQALHELNSELHNISIITYDELLSRGERQLEIVCEDNTVSKEINDEYDLPF